MTLTAIGLVLALVAVFWRQWVKHERTKARHLDEIRTAQRYQAAVGITEARPWSQKAAKGWKR